MTPAQNRKPAQKGRPPRRKKNKIRQMAPVLAVGALLTLFIAWRSASVLLENREHPQVKPAAGAARALDKGVRETRVEKGRREKEAPDREPVPPPVPPPAEPERPPKAGKPAPEVPTAAEPAKAPAPKPPEARQAADAPSPPAKSEGAGKVAIVIDDVGSNIELLRQAMSELPKSVTFAVMPFQPYSKESADLLHAGGFHVILHSPMQAEDPQKSQALIVAGMSRRDVAEALEQQLGSVPWAEGLNNHTGSKATKDPRLMFYVMDELKKKGLFFLDSRTTPFTEAYRAARSAGVKAAERKVFLDDESIESGILLKVDELALLGIKENKAVGIGHLRPNTIKVLSKRLSYWAGRGVTFIPLREAVE